MLTQTAPGTQNRLWTYDELIAERPESNSPCELWDGELIMAPMLSFYHQEIALRFYRELHDWVAERKLGKVMGLPIDMVLSPHRVPQPDITFVSKERLHIIQRSLMGPADLVAEIISPGGRTRDRIEKRDLYEQYGVREYWIIDPEAQMVEVLALEGGQYTLAARAVTGEAAASRLLHDFQVDVSRLFVRD
ncbi:MAG TPA: Uma2 family endonuclease [Chthoniobacterales bacterium]|nr:Uma2 family endonuclease [Chthoniobacterales bacterium]